MGRRNSFYFIFCLFPRVTKTKHTRYYCNNHIIIINIVCCKYFYIYIYYIKERTPIVLSLHISIKVGTAIEFLEENIKILLYFVLFTRQMLFSCMFLLTVYTLFTQYDYYTSRLTLPMSAIRSGIRL